MMQRHVGVTSAQAREQWSHEAGKGYEGVAAEGAEQQVEPNHVGLEPVKSLQNAEYAARIVERPASQDAESGRFDMVGRDFVGQDGKA
jgi:hypothetical protein